MFGLDPLNILSWKKYIFKHIKCIFKLKKVENTVYKYILAIAGQTAELNWLKVLKGTHGGNRRKTY